MPFTANLPAENTDPWDTAIRAWDTSLKSFVNGLETTLGTKVSSADLSSGLATKVNSSTYTSGMAAKADLVDGKVPTSQIPAVAITSFLGTVSSQAAMLALSGQEGDWTVRTDNSTTWIITGNDPTQLSSWTQVLAPSGGGGAVNTVNGQTGTVVLGFADVGAASAAQGAKADTAVQPGALAPVATSGAYNDLTGKPTLGTAAAQDSTAFATAAQGAKADTAVQPAALDAYVAEADVAGLDDVGWGRAVFIANGGTIPAGTPAYTIVIEAAA